MHVTISLCPNTLWLLVPVVWEDEREELKLYPVGFENVCVCVCVCTCSEDLHTSKKDLTCINIKTLEAVVPEPANEYDIIAG